MVSFGAVMAEPSLKNSFYGKTRPISDNFNENALSKSGFTRAEHEGFDDPKIVMEKFRQWILKNSKGRPVFMSDNLAFDWQWINYYFHEFLGMNPFGFSGRRIGDIYCGMRNDMNLNEEWKDNLRKTEHDHNPVHDAMGNAEALLSLQKMGLRFQDLADPHSLAYHELSKVRASVSK